MTEPDRITLEVIKNRLDSIADQIALVLMRSAYSPIVRDSLDYSTAICDRDGRFLAQGLTTALHLGSFPFAMRNLLDKAGRDMRPGDVFIFNDPYGSGGMHLPDIYLVKPVFFKDAVEGFATALVHHADIGGIAPGAMAVYATEIFQEGFRIPLMKLFSEGQPNESLFQLLAANVRIPRQVVGDLRAQVAGVRRGEHGLLEVLERYGAKAFYEYGQALHAQAEAAMRRSIAAIPDGIYTCADELDGLGEEPQPIRLEVTVTVKDDSVVLDWSGTSEQVRAAVNAPVPFIHSASYLAFRCLAGHEIPNAEGYTVPIAVHAPPGTIVNPTLPAAANARGIVGFRAFDAVLGALSSAVPEAIPAAGEGGAINFGVGGQVDGEADVFGETTMGAWGGRPDRDGIDGAANLAANQSNQPIELIEAENPIRIEHYGFVANSGGPGKHRGGQSILRRYRFLAEGLLTFRSDRRAQLPPGRVGGLPGTPNINLFVDAGGSARTLPVLPLEGYPVKRGDAFFQVVPGAGGYGDRFERPAAQVRNDVLDGKITPDYARQIYGVVIEGEEIDNAATKVLRSARAKPADHVSLFWREFATLVPGGLAALRDCNPGATPTTIELLASVDIDLDAIRHNIEVTRGLIGARTRLYGVVKGDAYGVGIMAAADTLAEAGVDGFAAGAVHEALAIRARWPRLPVLVYGTYDPGQIPRLARAGIAPTLFSPDCVRAAVACVEPMSVFVEVDCGFGRLGLLEQEVPDALKCLSSSKTIAVRGLYTHLGKVENSDAVAAQADRFARIASLVRSMGFAAVELMVASSRVLLDFPTLKLDAVNPGRLLYGLLEAPWRERVDIRPAFAAVRSRLIQIKDLAPGARLGYGDLDVDGRDVIRAGVAVIGFATGLPRTMAGAPVLVRGRRAKILGLASMEHLLIDLAGIPDAAVGDEVVLVGRQGGGTITGEELSRAVGLTELELLPRLGRALPRRYLRKGEVVTFQTTEEKTSNRDSLKRARV